jgi:serine/threonine-protein kinase
MTEQRNRLEKALAHSYRIDRELGAGGMATVYLADDLKHNRQVAVKVLHPELAAAVGPARFGREIEIAAKLTHPHILMLIDSGEADGFLFYVMPYVAGESLRDRLMRDGALPVAEAVRLLDQVASALTYAHGQGVIHRDIKPENILLAHDQAVVADFGIARAVEVAGGEKLTGTGIAIGTPAYMSPEQAFGQADVDGRTDVYALGCVLFEMVAGRLPFEAATPQALIAQHASDTVPSLRALKPEIPLHVDRAVCRAMAKEPGDRFASPKAMAETLRAERVVAPVGRQRLAVLPPVNITGDAEQQYLVLGLHESLISQLGRGEVAVLARTSVLQYQNTDKPIRDICRELSADMVVESSLFRAGESVGIEARLIDGNTEEGVWSGSFDGDVNSVFSLYREVTGAIAGEIHGVLGPKGRPTGAQTTVDPVAYEKYMRGRVYQQSFNPADLDRAMQYYDAALAIQPDYAPAVAGKALVWGSKLVLGLVPPLEYGPKWLEDARRAVELDPYLAEGHQALAQGYTWFEFDWERAEQAYRRAIELDPNEPQTHIFYSHFLGMMRRHAEAEREIERANEIDPFNPFTQLLQGALLGLMGRNAEGLELLATVPANPLRSHLEAWFNLTLGNLDEALTHYVRYFEMLGDEEVAAAMRDDGSGPEAGMLRGAEVLADRAEQVFVKPNNIVYLFTWGGDHERAIAWAERAIEMRDHEVTYWGGVSHAVDPLRSDPRFRALLEGLGLPTGSDSPRS